MFECPEFRGKEFHTKVLVDGDLMDPPVNNTSKDPTERGRTT